MFGDLVLGSVGIDVGKGQKECLFAEFERGVYIYQPIDQDMPHFC